ncbi:probable metabolite transport protein CsbC [Drosophila grimshawi]|uniref:GH19546 n=1 Tax=Drosophila grimshawi TaxID=7222 RepID=B4JHC2_DROGR|nr:probable metabolite transport protein CsbC [Drosophila grimshawi]EDV93829.1 GH19546 [Drosophila grimshawi]
MTIVVATTAAPPNTIYVTTEKGQVPPQTNYIPPPQVTYVEVNQRPRRYAFKQQTHSGAAGTMLFTYAGMDMAMCLGWNLNADVSSTRELDYSFFIGIIIGALVAGLSVSYLQKWIFYNLAGVMLMIDAIICVANPTEYASMVAARYVGGAGLGLLTVVFIIHITEASTSNERGRWCGVEQSGLALGIAIQVILDSQYSSYDALTVTQAHGIFGIVFTVFATSLLAFSIESPIFLLRKNKEDKAKLCQWQLMPPVTSTAAFEEAFAEVKRYVEEGNSQSIGVQLSKSVMPFIKLLLCRCLVAFTFSLPLSQAMLISTIVSETYLNWTVVVFGLLRWIASYFAISLVDTLGRKLTSVLGLVCMAGLMLAMAGILSDGMSSLYYMYQICRISMAFQFFAGIYAPCTSVYLGEAFPMRVKGFLIGLIVCIEQLIHIIVIVTTVNLSIDMFYQYFLAVGIILVVSLLILAVLMPETKKLTLRQAGERFQRVHDIKSY